MSYLPFNQIKHLYKSRAIVASAVSTLTDAVDSSGKAGSDSIKGPVLRVISDLNRILAAIGEEIVEASEAKKNWRLGGPIDDQSSDTVKYPTPKPLKGSTAQAEQVMPADAIHVLL